MTTRFKKKLIGAAASAFLLLALTGCGSSVVPLNSSSTDSSGGTSSGTSTGTGTTTTVTGGTTSVTSGSTTGSSTGTGTTVASAALAVSTPWSNAQIASGDSHTCVLDTSGAVWCWGYNNSGQLGNGTTTNGKFPARALVLTSGATVIAAGGDHTCALDSARSVWCWGANESGELGNGNTTMSKTPVRVLKIGSGVLALSAGFKHTCAIDSTYVVWCWGSNTYGQLGNGTLTNSTVPVQTITDFAGGAQALSLGNVHTCATNAAGGLYCWGFNNQGRLGDGTTTNRSTPTLVSNMSSGIMAVAAGYVHTCAVDSTGLLWCWGDNTYGELGIDSTQNDSLVPAQVSTLAIGVQSIALGSFHSCVTDGSNVSCWGDDKYGQAGTTVYSNQFSPIAVNGLSGTIQAISSGGFFSCVFDGVGIQCWGNDSYDKLGAGT